jgi:hypothetical protein
MNTLHFKISDYQCKINKENQANDDHFKINVESKTNTLHFKIIEVDARQTEIRNAERSTKQNEQRMFQINARWRCHRL